MTLTTPVDQAIYFLGQAVAAGYTCQDEAGGSGLAFCVGSVPYGSPIDTASLGGKVFPADAAENAGDFASLTHLYSVLVGFSGFFQLVDNLPTLNIVPVGLGVPFRFSLGGDRGLNIFAAGYPASTDIPLISSPPPPTASPHPC